MSIKVEHVAAVLGGGQEESAKLRMGGELKNPDSEMSRVMNSISVTAWGALRESTTPTDASFDYRVSQRVWEIYLVRLSSLVIAHLIRMATENAAAVKALSVLDGFWANARENRFPQRDDGHDLWRVLVNDAVRIYLTKSERPAFAEEITTISAITVTSSETVATRETVTLDDERNVTPEPMQEFAARVATRLILVLVSFDGRPLLSLIVSLKIKGYSDRDIARRLGLTDAEVREKLETIMENWPEAADKQAGSQYEQAKPSRDEKSILPPG